MRHMVSSRAALALMTFKAFALGALLALVVGVYVNADAGQDSIVRPPAAVNVDAYTQVVARKMAEHHCSATGFGAEQVPGSALVRTAQGKLRMVSFDEGWAIFTGDAPGTLVAVCLDEAPPAR
ncbi:hypothetical protein [Nocardioides sp.]|uniref:hypothetical protein n=1 Tax=Nocardioides sp. TaxID=35761 RepID=UPI0031FE6E24|nr:hypothetical protein [Nocardioides sp.]